MPKTARGMGMNVCKADAIAHLAKWYNAGTEVSAIYHSVTGNQRIIGRIEELSSSAIKVVTIGSEMLLYFRDTSEYEYSDVRKPTTEINDVRKPTTEINKDRINKYPIFIEITFSNGDRLEVSEYFKE
jgi:hypothetical protein